ncbi:MAG: glycosyltransferase family 4 protein [Thermales bacterium]|nr:glycosyltransferase family 4 protein [Thermales bacterium]
MACSEIKNCGFACVFRPKGGGEKLIFDIRDYYGADLFTGAIDKDIWDPSKAKTDSFVKRLYDKKYKFEYLHEDSPIPFWKKIKRQLYFRFSPKIKVLNKYDVVIFSGNIAGVAGRITNPNTKKIVYTHTPPRPFTDQLESRLKKMSPWQRPWAKLFAKWVIAEYRKEMKKMDVVITNSKNIQKRLKKFVGIDSTPIFPAINTKRFQWIDQGDYFISYARLEDLKRIPMIIDAFEKMPKKKMVLCSSGPLAGWVQEEIEKRGLKNITYEGLVTDERLEELVGGCLAGIYIPIEEDAGIIQCELMAAGKPVIGVNEGGLKESVIDKKTGILIKSNPVVEDVIEGVKWMTPDKALKMKEACIQQAKQFDSKEFFKKFNKELEGLTGLDKKYFVRKK